MEHVAQQSRYTLDFGLVDDKQWNMASELSRPDVGSYVVVPAWLEAVFERIALDRPAGPSAAATGSISHTRPPLSASYPQSPSQATGRPAGGSQQQRGTYRPGHGYGDGPQGVER
jgi:cell filamentation protein